MPIELPLSVWPTAQRTARAQRAGRYLDVSGVHPAKMLPAIAARAVATYTQPGDLVRRPHVPASARRSSKRSTKGATPSASSTSPAGPNSPKPTSPSPAPKAPPGTAR